MLRSLSTVRLGRWPGSFSNIRISDLYVRNLVSHVFPSVGSMEFSRPYNRCKRPLSVCAGHCSKTEMSPCSRCKLSFLRKKFDTQKCLWQLLPCCPCALKITMIPSKQCFELLYQDLVPFPTLFTLLFCLFPIARSSIFLFRTWLLVTRVIRYRAQPTSKHQIHRISSPSPTSCTCPNLNYCLNVLSSSPLYKAHLSDHAPPPN